MIGTSNINSDRSGNPVRQCPKRWGDDVYSSQHRLDLHNTLPTSLFVVIRRCSLTSLRQNLFQ